MGWEALDQAVAALMIFVEDGDGRHFDNAGFDTGDDDDTD
jgi:hypothetical protein